MNFFFWGLFWQPQPDPEEDLHFVEAGLVPRQSEEHNPNTMQNLWTQNWWAKIDGIRQRGHEKSNLMEDLNCFVLMLLGTFSVSFQFCSNVIRDLKDLLCIIHIWFQCY